MQSAIGYLRVSTRKQGRSGLGLAAQRFDIEAFGAREAFSVKSWHQDVQTGAGKDALLLRPGLAAALKEAKAARCPLIVSRLERLSRNVHFITGLMEHKVHFVVAALGKDCDDFTLTNQSPLQADVLIKDWYAPDIGVLAKVSGCRRADGCSVARYRQREQRGRDQRGRQCWMARVSWPAFASACPQAWRS